MSTPALELDAKKFGKGRNHPRVAWSIGKQTTLDRPKTGP